MISLYDNEGNVPLHSAVHGGDIKAVELCLKSGAKISTQQYDLSTPVHLACAQVCFIFFNISKKCRLFSAAVVILYENETLRIIAKPHHPKIIKTNGQEILKIHVKTNKLQLYKSTNNIYRAAQAEILCSLPLRFLHYYVTILLLPRVPLRS